MTLNQRLKQDLKADRYNLGHLAKEASVSHDLERQPYTINSRRDLPRDVS